MTRLKTWPVVALALSGLLLLVVVSLVATRHKAQAIYLQLEDLSRHHREVEARLRRLRGDVHVSSIFVRDYLLDTSRANAPEYRERLTRLRGNNMATLAELRELLGPADAGRIASLEVKLKDYWEGFEPLFDWTATQKLAQSPAFLRKEVLPRRDAVLAIAEEVEALNNDAMNLQREQVATRERELRAYLDRMLLSSILLGALVAVTAVIRIKSLERRAEEQHLETRRLSQQLVRTQEDERRNLSRELHDHVGQMLTALRLELGRAERLRYGAGDGFTEAVSESKRLAETITRTVRDLSMGLRPSMLDDFGLGPALEWHVRECSRGSGVPVDLAMKGDVEHLPDVHRTCVYRVVQEALTNCARHSEATYIAVALTVNHGSIDLAVHDNGKGMSEERRGPGLGLLGIQERVRELGGSMTLTSTPNEGTTLGVRIPVEEHVLADSVG